MEKTLDHFDITDYPAIAEEVMALKISIGSLRSEHAGEIIISFLKDHSIRTDWVKHADPVAMFIRSRTAKVKNIEALFAASKDSPVFRKAFEDYLTERFKPGAIL